MKFLLSSTVEWMKTANSHTDIFPVLNFIFLSVDIACIAIPMSGCTVNFPDKICCDQPFPHAGKDPAVCVSSSVNMPLLVDPVALGSVREFVKMRPNCEDNSWGLVLHNTTQMCIFLSF